MADLAAAFQIVSRASLLALQLYRLATGAPGGIRDVTSSISSFASTVKQVGTIIREDDSLPSLEAIEILNDVLDQGNALLDQIESLFPVQPAHGNRRYESHLQGSHLWFEPSGTAIARLGYLVAHLNSLRSTLSVMVQTMHTAQSIIWARTRRAISPQQAAAAVANEKMQLEILVIEQQVSILSASKLYDPSRFDARLLMEHDSSQSLVSVGDRRSAPNPASLFQYQEIFVASLDTSDMTENDWLPAICGISRSYLERLLEKWTRLRRLQERIDDEEQRMDAQKRETQQPTVESDIEDEIGSLPDVKANTIKLSTPTPHRPVNTQPLFTESTTFPIPVPDSRFGPAAPLSPVSSYGISPKTSGTSLPTMLSPISPRSSLSLPVEAAAAVEAKEEDDDIDLKIPWRLCTRQHYWDYIDRNIMKTNSDLPPPNPFTDRIGRTEILASWVCKEAIQEAGFSFTKVQKDRLDGRRTKFETCFVIQQALSFDQVECLVERTVEIYRQNKPPTPPLPPPRQRRTSFDRPRPDQRPSVDGDWAPLASKKQPLPPAPLDRSSSFSYPPPLPPPLDRSFSLPGPLPPYPPRPTLIGHPTTPHLPLPTAPYTTYVPSYSTPFFQPSSAPSFAVPPQAPIDLRRQNTNRAPFVPPPPATQPPQPPTRRFSNSKPRFEDGKSTRHDQHYSGASTASDDENAGRRRSRARRPSSSRRMKHSTVGTLAKVGGLAALLDGIVDLGVL